MARSRQVVGRVRHGSRSIRVALGNVPGQAWLRLDDLGTVSHFAADARACRRLADLLNLAAGLMESEERQRRTEPKGA